MRGEAGDTDGLAARGEEPAREAGDATRVGEDRAARDDAPSCVSGAADRADARRGEWTGVECAIRGIEPDDSDEP